MRTLKHNDGIALVRVGAMLSILLCHVVKYYTFVPGHLAFSQMFNVGVEMFLFLSGYLYGGREISDFKSWIGRRWVKVCFPVLVWDAVLFLLHWESDVRSFFTYACSIQGLSWISDFLDFYEVNRGLGHTWFLTVILLCYFLVPALQSAEKRGFFARSGIAWNLLILWAFAALLPLAHVQGSVYVAVFITGYLFRCCRLKQRITGKALLFGAVLFGLSGLTRLALRHYFDGTVFYEDIAVRVTMAYMACYIVAFCLKAADAFPKQAAKLCSGKAFRWLEDNSFYIYIVHMKFLNWEIYGNCNLAVSTVLFIVWNVVMAMALKWGSDLLWKFIRRLFLKGRRQEGMDC